VSPARVSTVALLMAGGSGERMRASGVELPKPLVPVGGVPLIERNLHQLLRHGLSDIVVAVPAAQPLVGDFVRDRLRPLAAERGARLEVLTETTPLGNIGCAGLLRDVADPLLTVYADNLTTLDLRAILAHHADTGAALTLAAHDEPFRLPYGRLEIADGRVTAYREKPTLAVTVCSAVTVLGPTAMAVLPTDRPTGLVGLTGELLRRGESVSAFRHTAPWVDVNDAAALARAEALVAAHPAEFRWPREPVPFGAAGSGNAQERQ